MSVVDYRTVEMINHISGASKLRCQRTLSMASRLASLLWKITTLDHGQEGVVEGVGEGEARRGNKLLECETIKSI